MKNADQHAKEKETVTNFKLPITREYVGIWEDKWTNEAEHDLTVVMVS